MDKYQSFAGEFSDFLSDRYPEISFFVYGSFSRGNYVPEESDIDGGLIFPEGVVLPKEKVRDISNMMARCLKKNRVVFQANLMDMKTCSDGRFNSFTADYIKHIKKEHKILSGPDFIPSIKQMDYKSGVLSSAAFNLRSVRRKLLHAVDEYFHDPELFDKNLRKSIDKTLKFPKKLFWLQGRDDIVTSIPKACRELERVFPGFDVSKLDRLYEAKRNHVVEDLEDSLDLYSESARVIEEITDRYLDTFPDITMRETRG